MKEEGDSSQKSMKAKSKIARLDNIVNNNFHSSTLILNQCQALISK